MRCWWWRREESSRGWHVHVIASDAVSGKNGKTEQGNFPIVKLLLKDIRCTYWKFLKKAGCHFIDYLLHRRFILWDGLLHLSNSFFLQKLWKYRILKHSYKNVFTWIYILLHLYKLHYKRKLQSTHFYVPTVLHILACFHPL